MNKQMTPKARRFLTELVDTRGAQGEALEAARDVAGACRWFERAVALYGSRRVMATALSLARSYGTPEEVNAWAAYLRRWRARQNRHLIPRVVLVDGWILADSTAARLALAPRVA